MSIPTRAMPVLLLILACLLAPGPAGAQSPPLERVSVRLQWVHQAQFAGFYVAQDQGLYAQAGLEVEVRPFDGAITPLDEVMAGRVDFGTAWLTEALARASRGEPLVNLAQVIQRSALLLVVFSDSGINELWDLAGRRVGLWPQQFAIAPQALFRRLGLKVEQVDQSVSMGPFLHRAVDAASAMLYNEYHKLMQAGVEPHQIKVFEFARLGMNFPEDGIYAHARLWAERPELCRRFVTATLEGWRWAFDQPERALESVMRRVHEAQLSSNKSHQRWMLSVMRDIITHRVGRERMGELAPGELDFVGGVLMALGFTERPVAAKDFAAPAWSAP